MYKDRADLRRVQLESYYRNRDDILARRKARRLAVVEKNEYKRITASLLNDRYVSDERLRAAGISASIDRLVCGGRFCPVLPCSSCGQFGVYLHGMKQWGEIIGSAARYIHDWQRNICCECLKKQESIQRKLEVVERYVRMVTEKADRDQLQYCDLDESCLARSDLCKCFFCSGGLVCIERSYQSHSDGEMYGQGVWRCRSDECRTVADYFSIDETRCESLILRGYKAAPLFVKATAGNMNRDVLKDRDVPQALRLTLAVSIMLKEKANSMKKHKRELAIA